MTGALIGPWCARCEQKRATWADRLCAACGAEIELELERSLDALARGEVTPKSITERLCRGYGNICAAEGCFGQACRYREAP